MNPVLVIFLAVGLLWGVILFRNGPKVTPAALASVLTAYLFSQVFFGYDFFHLNAGPIPPTIDRGLLALLGGVWLLWLWQTGWDRIRLDGTEEKRKKDRHHSAPIFNLSSCAAREVSAKLGK